MKSEFYFDEALKRRYKNHNRISPKTILSGCGTPFFCKRSSEGVIMEFTGLLIANRGEIAIRIILEEAKEFFASLGPDFGMMIKAVAGGGGRGSRIVFEEDQIEEAFNRCRPKPSTPSKTGIFMLRNSLNKPDILKFRSLETGGETSSIWVIGNAVFSAGIRN